MLDLRILDRRGTDFHRGHHLGSSNIEDIFPLYQKVTAVKRNNVVFLIVMN